ncbi:MAG: lysylphosphatidylglycerol synthase transmembrane domain-containing protein [Bryobacteraceae bacterium]
MNQRLALRTSFLLAGCALFVYLLVRLGPGDIAALVVQTGWYFAWMCLAFAGHQLVRAAAFSKCVTAVKRPSYWDLVRIRLSGEAVQYLTFTGPFLAEPAKALLLKTRGSDLTHAFAATISEYLFYLFTSAAMTLAGLYYLIGNAGISGPLLVAARIVATIAGAFLLTAAFAIAGRVYLIGAVVKAIGKLPAIGKRLRIDPHTLRETEDLLFVLLRARPGRFVSILGIEFVAQALLILEVFLFLKSMGTPFPILDSLLIEAAGKFIGLGFFFVPAQIGVAEGAYSLIFQGLGFSATAGFGLALARRFRSLLIAAAGLLLLPQWSGGAMVR